MCGVKLFFAKLSLALHLTVFFNEPIATIALTPLDFSGACVAGGRFVVDCPGKHPSAQSRDDK